MKHWLYLEFWWVMNNLIAHPISHLLWWLSLFGWIKIVASFPIGVTIGQFLFTLKKKEVINEPKGTVEARRTNSGSIESS